MEFDEKIRQFLIQKRQALGLTQEEFAELTLNKKNRERISVLENGKKKMRFSTLTKMLKNLNCDIEIIER